MENNQNTTIRTRKVGSLSMGICCVLFGVLFLLRTCIPDLTYEYIIKFWPLVLIILGLEILLSCIVKKDCMIKIDFFSVFMIFLVMVFVIGMGGTELILEYEKLRFLS